MHAKIVEFYGFLDDRKYRDYCIKEDFAEMRKAGMKVEKIELELSERYSTEKNPLTPESINGIIYRK